jgi:hypothetical protein
MKSEDFGRTWKRSDGSVIGKSITVDNVETIARGGVDLKKSLRAGCLAVSPKGKPHLLYSTVVEQKGEAWLAVADGKGKWSRRRLNDHLSPEWRSFNLIMAGGLTFDLQGRLHGVGQLQTGEQNEKIWGDPTNEIVAFTMIGKDRIQFRSISKFDPKTSHWLPNIERPTGHNVVPALPGVLFTGGSAGKANTNLLSNRVYFGR